MSEELKPCPFCGSEKHMVFPPTCQKSDPYNPNDRAAPMVRCSGCYTDVYGLDWDNSGKTAAAAWNRRTPTEGVTPKEPVAYTSLAQLDGLRKYPGHILSMWANGLLPPNEEIPLYTSPQPPAPVLDEVVGDNQPRYTTKRIRDEIDKARAYARREALEEAALVADKIGAGFAQYRDHYPMRDGAYEVARAIRALYNREGE